jgi:D-arginine dehydrogenase
MESFDIAVIGAGIAGASVAYELAGSARVLLIERESSPGYHTTGRSAAQFVETYGHETVRRLTRGSRSFFDAPPADFSRPILTPMGAMFIAGPDQLPSLERHYSAVRALTPNVEKMTPAEALARVPVLRPEKVAGAVLEPDATGIDVHSLHTGYLRGFRRLGGVIRTDGEVTKLHRTGSAWQIDLAGSVLSAKIIVNAAGAWCDVVAALGGMPPIGLQPMRRTAIVFATPDTVDPRSWPLVLDVDEQFYFRPEGQRRILATPADETPMPPCDVRPDEIDIAVTVDRIQTVTTLPVARIESSWAGLRSFVADRTPVVGYSDGASEFFWLAGQGGYGIQTAPAMARAAAAMVLGADLPADLRALGLTQAALSPHRLKPAPK